MEAKFFGSFHILHLNKKSTYKLELLKRWKIHNIFHMSLLKQDITKKRQVDEKVRQINFEVGNNKEYKIEAIWNSMVYARESDLGYLPRIYYLVL